MSKTKTTHILYRMWNAKEELIYIGISKSAIVRLSQHQQTKEWATEIHNITLEYFYSRELCKLAETKAIKSEKPKYNIVHNQNWDYIPQQIIEMPMPSIESLNEERKELLSAMEKASSDKVPHWPEYLDYLYSEKIRLDKLEQHLIRFKK
tara:strand:- start:423 stop:872 length:450 start_codon:yes stop_codon:yes gene_type:complete